jgi:hypothetical protein
MTRTCLPAGFVLAVALLMLGGCGPDKAAPSSRKTPAITRADFEAKTSGKTEAEVLRTVGKPDETSEDDNNKVWTYRNRTYDPLIGSATKTDRYVLLHISKKRGAVHGVSFAGP